MAPTLDVAASELKRDHDNGIIITKVKYEGGKHPCVKFWWKSKGKCPEKFVVIIVEVVRDKWYQDGEYWTKKGYAQIKLGKFHLQRGCKHKLLLVNCENHKDIYCESEGFWVN